MVGEGARIPSLPFPSPSTHLPSALFFQLETSEPKDKTNPGDIFDGEEEEGVRGMAVVLGQLATQHLEDDPNVVVAVVLSSLLFVSGELIHHSFIPSLDDPNLSLFLPLFSRRGGQKVKRTPNEDITPRC
ncbi:hypothetical protein MLD38_014945 [Melastoma candidum]|uniref:Uncharacterized protein n=1 Tax=Melastoma candidum TaxID=119954 RepID=A0ACB9RMW7_9MYRT|nr:hypothetical protein MLD38_014945 [Melastoma candidum]